MLQSIIFTNQLSLPALSNTIDKKYILDEIATYYHTTIVEYNYTLLKSFDNHPIITSNLEYIVLPYYGNEYWLYFTYLNNQKVILLIPKYIKHGYVYPKIFVLNTYCDMNIIPEHFFHSTLIAIELITLEQQNIFVCSDIYIYNGLIQYNQLFLNRIEFIYSNIFPYLMQSFLSYNQLFTFEVKYLQLLQQNNNAINLLLYHELKRFNEIKGLCFQSNDVIIIPDTNKILKPYLFLIHQHERKKYYYQCTNQNHLFFIQVQTNENNIIDYRIYSDNNYQYEIGLLHIPNTYWINKLQHLSHANKNSFQLNCIWDKHIHRWKPSVVNK